MGFGRVCVREDMELELEEQRKRREEKRRSGGREDVVGCKFDLWAEDADLGYGYRQGQGTTRWNGMECHGRDSRLQRLT